MAKSQDAVSTLSELRGGINTTHCTYLPKEDWQVPCTSCT